MTVNKALFDRNVFGIPRRKVKYADGFQARLVHIGDDKPEGPLLASMWELFNLGVYEQLPWFINNPDAWNSLDWMLNPAKRREVFESRVEDASTVILMENQHGMVMGYLLMTPHHYILDMYVIPAFRRDRIGLSLLELYINRFDVREITCSLHSYDLDPRAFLTRLGFCMSNATCCVWKLS
ncbi:hypothetical protein D3C79_49140 [compost metagenome]